MAKRLREPDRAAGERPTVKLSGGQPCPDGQVNLWRAGKLCDATVHVDGRAFQVHRAVLAGASEFMSALFTSGMRDSDEPSISEVAGDVFSALLEWIYCGECRVEADLLGGMLDASSRLQLASLQSATVEALVQGIDTSNAVQYWECGDAHNIPRLVEAAKAAALQSFGEFSTCVAFDALPIGRVCELLKSDALKADSEEIVFRAAARWAAANLSASEQEVGAVYSHVKYGLLPAAFLSSVVEQDPPLVTHPRGGWIVARSLKAHIDQGSSPRGPLVTVLNPGSVYGGFEAMAVHLGVRDEWDRRADAVAGDKGVPLAMGQRSSSPDDKVVAVRILRTGSVILIGQLGLELVRGAWPASKGRPPR
ncbi:hypothetical protein EMIHUDRAFT_104201 [Emiliania huxleyi CCMP1516]|uniref:BTB domain-containing protein n=2 Tax=Emiliania huxleyi TaxID=2903 RepID=A0A0D3IN70_EMIH1|nr:hypothetical protein EMIHUDRAFT_104201 [Emiliania huxleyi CCMP1516]EOD12705.1 hypothetical protein EMIHUDRAFT_104201 [Emiliania huxleyi CCMP1516]|eukprot:XP_005765134.1 hypothetical protein EMIHUDRAFT_104201 [Emiliania huxleyi CCMP1516]